MIGWKYQKQSYGCYFSQILKELTRILVISSDIYKSMGWNNFFEYGSGHGSS
jgi:hypothetical protein